MNKLSLGYSFIFFSFYKFYSRYGESAKEFPQGWAVTGFSAWSVLVVSFVEEEIRRSGFVPLTDMAPYLHIPLGFTSTWLLWLIGIFNFVFFLTKKRWQRCIKPYERLSSKAAVTVHGISIFLMVLAVFLTFYQITTT